jgi:hypothetical protein
MDNDAWLSRTRFRATDSGELEWWDDPVPEYVGGPAVPRLRALHPFFAAREAQAGVSA